MCSISLFVIILLLCLINNVPSAYKCISTYAVTFGILILSISRVYNELIIKWHYALIISLHIQNGIIDIAFVNHFKKQPTFEFQLYAISKIQKSYTLLGNEGSCHVFCLHMINIPVKVLFYFERRKTVPRVFLHFVSFILGQDLEFSLQHSKC